MLSTQQNKISSFGRVRGPRRRHSRHQCLPHEAQFALPISSYRTLLILRAVCDRSSLSIRAKPPPPAERPSSSLVCVCVWKVWERRGTEGVHVQASDFTLPCLPSPNSSFATIVPSPSSTLLPPITLIENGGKGKKRSRKRRKRRKPQTPLLGFGCDFAFKRSRMHGGEHPPKIVWRESDFWRHPSFVL